ncbi:oligosaccharide repeat unit polymerase [Vibrio cholerae]|uniref:O-antigen polymerase n=4 Tax=Vibrio TaxID=662 RepID=UPI0018F091D8|nr:O-antigen polymerase [Vibrio cholerae]MBJ6925151.1 oligosaccharide repeat unit polymerase [Vibrio cholerae]
MTFIFLFLFFFTPIFSLFLLRLAGERLNQVSIVNITTVAIYLFSVLGTFVLFFQLNEYSYNIGVQDPSLVLVVLFCSAINVIFFLFGVIFLRKIVGFDVVPFRSYEIRSISWIQSKLLLLIFAFCIVVLINYLRQLDRIALIVALTDGANAAKEARSVMGNSFSGKYHWYKLVIHDLGNLVTFTSFAIWLIRKRAKDALLLITALSYSVFVAIMATEKGPMAWLLIGLFMVYFLVRSNGFIPFKKLLPFAFLIVGLLITSYVYFMGSEDVGSALGSVFSRAFSGSILPAYFYLEFFPEYQEYLLGRSFPNPGGLMPYEPYRYTIEVMNWLFPDLVETGVVGTAPTVFWGEAYANFGPLGIPIVAFIIGCLIALVSYLVSKLEINPLTIGFFVWLILIFKDLSVTGFSDYLYNIYIISLSVIMFAMLAVRGFIRVRRKMQL